MCAATAGMPPNAGLTLDKHEPADDDVDSDDGDEDDDGEEDEGDDADFIDDSVVEGEPSKPTSTQ